MSTRFPIKLLPETLLRAGFKIAARRAARSANEPSVRQEQANEVEETKKIMSTDKKGSATLDSHGRTRASKRKALDELEHQPACKKCHFAAYMGETNS